MKHLFSRFGRSLFWALPVAGFLVSAPRADAQIVVTGPATPAAHILMAWFAHHLPARLGPHGRFEVTPLTDNVMDDYLRTGDTDQDQNSHTDDGEIDGIFEDNPPRITLRLSADGLPDLYTFAHEYGHYVWFDLLSDVDKKRYESVYKKQKAAHHLVTRYASTGLEEGFAEAFSFYANEAPLLRHRDPLSYQFLNQWVAPGAAATP
jgi:hypothetical protein